MSWRAGGLPLRAGLQLTGARRAAQARVNGPDLKKFMEKRLTVKLNGARTVTGVLRGYDQARRRARTCVPAARRFLGVGARVRGRPAGRG